MVEEADETRLENRLWELQKRFYEKEISDCLEDLNDCEKEK
jgi:ribulose bisphosphate carboxylase small subunit